MQMLHGSMTHNIYGRKRSTNAWKKAKPYQPKVRLEDTYSLGDEGKKHREAYPSLSEMGMDYVTPEDKSYKLKESKNYTVAIGYNKGTYQVIPQDEIKSIGRK
jgi:hypothetical protein